MDDFSAESSFELTVADTTARAVALIDDDVREVARASKAKNTLLAYRSNWTAFQAWCANRGVTSLPAEPETVSAYLLARMKEGLKASSLAVAVAAIRRTWARSGGSFMKLGCRWLASSTKTRALRPGLTAHCPT
jgi:hypothetical protein